MQTRPRVFIGLPGGALGEDARADVGLVVGRTPPQIHGPKPYSLIRFGDIRGPRSHTL